MESGAIDNLTEKERVKYGLIGSALDIMAIHEKYHIELSPDFLKDVTQLKMSGEEVSAYVKEFEKKGITKMQDMTDYLRGYDISTDKEVLSSSMLETLKTLYPEKDENQLQNKLGDMEKELRVNNI